VVWEGGERKLTPYPIWAPPRDLNALEDGMDSHDHRVLGPRLDLFHQQDEAPGTAFWHPRGATTYRLIEGFIRREMRRAGFQEVRTPQLLSRSLWGSPGLCQPSGIREFGRRSIRRCRNSMRDRRCD